MIQTKAMGSTHFAGWVHIRRTAYIAHGNTGIATPFKRVVMHQYDPHSVARNRESPNGDKGEQGEVTVRTGDEEPEGTAKNCLHLRVFAFVLRPLDRLYAKLGEELSVLAKTAIGA